MSDDITLDQVLKVLRDQPAHSPLVESTVKVLVLQIMCGKFDGKEVASSLAKLTFALASGPDTMQNAMYALGAASTVSEDCKRQADAMTPKSKSHPIGWIFVILVFIGVFIGILVTVWGPPLGHLSLWWKIPLSLVALIVACILGIIAAFFAT